MIEEMLSLDKLYEGQSEPAKSEFETLYTKEEQQEILDAVRDQLTGHDFIDDVYFTDKEAIYEYQEDDYPGAQCLRVNIDMHFSDYAEDISCDEDGVTAYDLREAGVSFADCEDYDEITRLSDQLVDRVFETEHFKIQVAYDLEAQDWDIEDVESYNTSSHTEGEGDISMRQWGYYREYTVTEGDADFTWNVQADLIIAVTRK